MNLLPTVKRLERKNGYLSKNYIAPYTEMIDFRLKKAIDKLPCKEDGVKLVINTDGSDCEKYSITISENTVEISSDGLNGAFYAIQTLRQILKNNEITCMYIEDEPDFKYRGLYHDITRGRNNIICLVSSISCRFFSFHSGTRYFSISLLLQYI